MIRKKLLYHRDAVLFILATFGVYFIFLFARMLQFRPDGLWAGHVHVWGDWSLHIAMANIFAYKNPSEWFAYHPYYAGGKFTYAFLTNMISGLLIRAGLTLPGAFLLPSIFYVLILLLGIYAVFYQVLGTKKASITALTLFFFSSGPGFLRLFTEWQKVKSLQFLIFPPIDYTRLEKYQWLAGNAVNGMLVPQRSFLFGMAITVWVMSGLLYALRHPEIRTKWRRLILVACGIGAGILPIAHMHSFIVLVIISACIGLTQLKNLKVLLWYAIPAGIVSSLFYFIFVAGGIENPKFMQIMIGWTSDKTLRGWLWMWCEIWGTMIPVSLAGLLLLRKKSALLISFFFGFFIVFILANIIMFQPIAWDNSKLFLWTYFGLCGLAALTLQWLWRKQILFKGVALIIAFTLTASGAVELSRLQHVDQNSYRMSDLEDIHLGEVIRHSTPPLAVFLTQPSHNHPVMMWGVRSIVMGYPAWALNFGFLYEQRQQDIMLMYSGGQNTEKLLKKYAVQFVAIGPGELYDMQANETYFRNTYPIFIETAKYRIYDVRKIYTIKSSDGTSSAHTMKKLQFQP